MLTIYPAAAASGGVGSDLDVAVLDASAARPGALGPGLVGELAVTGGGDGKDAESDGELEHGGMNSVRREGGKSEC